MVVGSFVCVRASSESWSLSLQRVSLQCAMRLGMRSDPSVSRLIVITRIWEHPFIQHRPNLSSCTTCIHSYIYDSPKYAARCGVEIDTCQSNNCNQQTRWFTR